jgi:NADH-quinone oxidoreductase subunit N
VYVDILTIGLVWPEVILVLIATWMYLAGTLSRGRVLWTSLAAVTYGVAFFVLLWKESGLWTETAVGQVGFSGPLIIDYLGQATRFLALTVGLLVTLVASRAGLVKLSTEILATIMMLTAGVMLVGRANDLVLLFVALELISIPTYVILFLGRRDSATEEATAKYFFLSLLASAILLYGMTFLYGVGGGTTMIAGDAARPGIREAVGALSPEQLPLYLAGLVMVVAGLGFKIAAVPFHFYAPDVYEGTTNTNAGLLAVAPKIAGIVALVRLVSTTLPPDAAVGWQLALVLALITMTVGNVCALWQRNLRRLLAYSSIAHAGYMLIGLAVGLAAPNLGGIAAMLFYLAVYALASLGTFASLAYLSSGRHEVSDISEVAGLARAHPWIAGAIAVCMFSLAGIPPLAGFWGKLTLFSGAVRLAISDAGGMSTWFLLLAVVAALNAATAAAYYLRVVGAMYFRPATTSLPAEGGPGALVAVTACIVLVVAVGVTPGVVLQDAERADPLMQQSREVRTASPVLPQPDRLTVQEAERQTGITSISKPFR